MHKNGIIRYKFMYLKMSVNIENTGYANSFSLKRNTYPVFFPRLGSLFQKTIYNTV